jgi:RNA polymerase sigma factor (sigma-70 family)
VSAPLPPFQAFLDEHSTDVWRFLVATVGRQDAEDCYQETLIAALRAYPRLGSAREKHNLRAWVLTIAHRKALDAHRASSRRAVPVGDPAEHEQDVARAGSQGDPAETDEELWGAVRELPERQRSAVVLRFVGDLSHRDIGAALECSEEAARRSLHEGLKKLREAVPA